MSTRTDRHQTFDRNGNVISERTEVVDTTAETNAEALRSLAQQALAANATYLGLSAAQKTANQQAHVDRLTRECSALIRLALGLLDSTAGT